MMEGFDLILGKDWLDMINPFVYWCSKIVFIQFGGHLHSVSSIPVAMVKACGIMDQGLLVSRIVSLDYILRVLLPYNP